MTTKKSGRSFFIDGENIQYTLTRRKGQKNIRLKIGKNGAVTVSAPYSLPVSRIEQFLVGKNKWITKHLQKRQEEAALYDPLKRFPVGGEWYTVVHAARKRKGKVTINRDQRTIEIDSVSTDPEHLKKILRVKFIKEAKEIIPGLTDYWSNKLGIPFETVSVRNQKTRWGSSSGKKHISINWRIICTPEKVMDYLIVHELVHQRQRNHSASFWTELENLFPGAAECDGWLKEHDMIMSLLQD